VVTSAASNPWQEGDAGGNEGQLSERSRSKRVSRLDYEDGVDHLVKILTRKRRDRPLGGKSSCCGATARNHFFSSRPQLLLSASFVTGPHSRALRTRRAARARSEQFQMVIIGFIAGDEPDAPFMENVLAIADLA
jgi:hypothetical protein